MLRGTPWPCKRAAAASATIIAPIIRPRMSTAVRIVALSVTLAGCTPSPTPTVRFLEDRADLENIGWMEEQAQETGVGLELEGLHALDERIAFLFGRLGVPAGTLRSVVLRTADGGATWREVMPPVAGSEVLHVAFADGDHGWALAAWSVEGPGDVVLYRTDDAGRTWAKAADIPRDTWSYPVSMTFADPAHGEIGMTYTRDDGSGDPAGVVLLATTDGGRNWQTVRRVPDDGTPTAEPSRRLAATGRDGSAWELHRGDFTDPHLVRRRSARGDAWRLVATIPERFAYGEGRVLAARDP